MRGPWNRVGYSLEPGANAAVVAPRSEVQLDGLLLAPQEPQGPLRRALDAAPRAHERAAVQGPAGQVQCKLAECASRTFAFSE